MRTHADIAAEAQRLAALTLPEQQTAMEGLLAEVAQREKEALAKAREADALFAAAIDGIKGLDVKEDFSSSEVRLLLDALFRRLFGHLIKMSPAGMPWFVQSQLARELIVQTVQEVIAMAALTHPGFMAEMAKQVAESGEKAPLQA